MADLTFLPFAFCLLQLTLTVPDAGIHPLICMLFDRDGSGSVQNVLIYGVHPTNDHSTALKRLQYNCLECVRCIKDDRGNEPHTQRQWMTFHALIITSH